MYCTKCGTEIKDDAKFCKKCGARQTPLEEENVYSGGRQKVRTPVPQNKNMKEKVRTYSNGAGRSGGDLRAVCGSQLFMVFCAVYSLNIVCGLISDFSLVKILLTVLYVVFNVGSWKIYSSSAKGQNGGSGTLLVQIYMTITLIVNLIPDIIMVVIGFSVLDYNIGISILLLIVAVLMAIYWIFLWRHVFSCCKILNGTGTVMNTSMYVFVIMCIGTVAKVIMFFAQSALVSAINNMVWNMGMYSNNINIELVLGLLGLQSGIISGLLNVAVAVCGWILYYKASAGEKSLAVR